MIERGSLPYFDHLLTLLAQGNRSVETSFGRHVHWGYWQDPKTAICSDDDYACAAERLTLELCAAAEIASGERVLDVGCGFGGTVASLNERHQGMRLTGLNLDGRQLERARKQTMSLHDNCVEFVQGDACELPFDDNSFDRVLALECVFLFPSRARFMREAFRVMRPGGTLALSDFVPSSLFFPLARIATEAPWLARYQFFGRCNLRYALDEYRTQASQIGLTLTVERNITRHTLPTYRYLRHLGRHVPPADGISGLDVALLAHILRFIGTLRLLNYYILAFRKPGARSS